MPKRIIICCDGTWNTPEPKYVTNVTKIARAIEPTDEIGNEQVVFYDWGVGTENKIDAMRGGAFGKGIDKNIQDAYRFLVHNYSPRDELFFIGFSRGAYTVRSVIGMIRNCWILKKSNAALIPKAYAIYRSRSGPDDKAAQKFRLKYARKANIHFLGVWDTVGALGIPLGLFRKSNEKKYGFHDTVISRIVKNAYHALAIDEKRKPFTPTIWKTKIRRKNTEQVWFAGVHSDIGGGYKEAGLSFHTLKWMLGKAGQCDLSIKNSYINSILRERSPDKLHNSFSILYKFFGPYIRKIGITNNDESLHPSVLKRYRSNKNYRPANLRNYINSHS